MRPPRSSISVRRLVPVLLLALLPGALAPVAARAQTAEASPFARRPYVLLAGGVGVQAGAVDAGAGGRAAGPHAGVGLALRVAGPLVLRAEWASQWYLRGAEPVYDCPLNVVDCGSGAPPRPDQLRSARLLAEWRWRDRPAASRLAYVVAGPALVWAADRHVDATTAAGATLGLGLGRRSVPRSERGVRLEAQYTALARPAAGTRGLVGLSLALWL